MTDSHIKNMMMRHQFSVKGKANTMEGPIKLQNTVPAEVRSV